MKNGDSFGPPQANAAGLSAMDFPALKKNPFLLKKKIPPTKTQTAGELGNAHCQMNPSSNFISGHAKQLTLNLSPSQPHRAANMTAKSQGVASCFTTDTIGKLLEETSSFAISGEYPSHCRSHHSTLGPKAPETMAVLQNRLSKMSSVEKLNSQEQASRRSSIKKIQSNQSRDKSTSKRGRGGSALRSNITGASPKPPALRVYQDFMRDI